MSSATNNTGKPASNGVENKPAAPSTSEATSSQPRKRAGSDAARGSENNGWKRGSTSPALAPAPSADVETKEQPQRKRAGSDAPTGRQPENGGWDRKSTPVEVPIDPDEKASKQTPDRNPILQGTRYAINVYQWKVIDGSRESAGTILSQSLNKVIGKPGSYAGDIALSQMRKLTPGMSSFPRIHKFCTADGTFVFDEVISLDEYFALITEEEPKPAKKPSKDAKDDKEAEGEAEKASPTIPRLELFYRSTSSTDAAKARAEAPKAEAPQLDMTMKENTLPDLQTLAAPTAPESTIAKDETLAVASTGNQQAITAGSLSEQDWATVLRNCAVMYGWKVDARSQRIVRAPRPAFRLRNSDETSTLGQFEPLRTEKDLDEYDDDLIDEESEEQEKSLVANMQAASLRGFEHTPPGIPNFRTNDDSRIEITVCSSALAMSMAKSDFSSNSTEASASGGFGGVTAGVSAGYAESKSKSSLEEHTSTSQTLVARYMYPRCDLFLRPEDLEPTPEFRELLRKVKDHRSLDALRLIQAQFGQLFCQELTLGARLLSTKMISSNTDATVESQKEQFKVSVGVSVQTPYGGASVKHEEEQGKAEEKKFTTTTSRESNVFEACGGDTILANNPSAWANSVANPALWRVINREELASLVDMLAEMPGYESAQMWFVQAMPSLSKYVRLNASLATNVRFKVTSPSNDLSCSNDGSAMFYLGYEQGSTVTPRLNGRSTTLEAFWLRLDLPNSKVLFSPATYRAPTIYGFQNFKVGDGTFGSQYNSAFTSAQWELISPFGVETPGSPYELKNFAKVILRTVPFQDANPSPVPEPAQATAKPPPVVTGAVAVSGVSKDATKPETTKLPPPPSPPPPRCHMTVFRNVQGVFVPAISDNDEYQYWRIEKVDGSPAGSPIKGGDTVRLTWRIADQSIGFRDYKDDVFGRRRNACPSELDSAVLYMKVPWPRFEHQNTPTALVMSAQASRVPVAEKLNVLPGERNYCLQDLTFRIDTVENKGYGDSLDYMLRGVTQGVDQDGAGTAKSANLHPVDMNVFPRPATDPLRVWGQIAAFGALSAPA